MFSSSLNTRYVRCGHVAAVTVSLLEPAVEGGLPRRLHGQMIAE
jgi:hypothetical protein